MTAIANIAALLVERFQLDPPINIQELVERFADLEFCAWPSNCDGIAILSDVRPKVFVRLGQPYRRERFTLAHELGHVVIPWHLNVVDCKPAETQELESEESYLGIHNEAEANEFASRILVPDRFMDAFRFAYAKPVDILNKLEQADISASAGVLAVRRVLLPGYVFVVPDLTRPVRSKGTEYVTDASRLRRMSIDCGVAQHQGKTVAWYQLAKAADLTSLIGTKSAAKLALRELAESSVGKKTGYSVQSIQQSVAGTIGASKSGLNGLKSSVILGVLLYLFSKKPELAPIVQDQRFYDYLSFKARELSGDLKS